MSIKVKELKRLQKMLRKFQTEPVILNSGKKSKNINEHFILAKDGEKIYWEMTSFRNSRYFGYNNNLPSCGTSGCVAGIAKMLNHPGYEEIELPMPFRHLDPMLMEIYGMTQKQVDKVFYDGFSLTPFEKADQVQKIIDGEMPK